MSKLLSRTAALAASSVLLFAACGGSDDSSGDAASTTVAIETTDAVATTVDEATGGSGGTDPTTTPATTAAASTSTTAAATTTVAPADTGECLVGEWVLTDDQMNAFYAGVMTTVDAPIGITASGFAGLTFAADGTYSWAPAFDLTVDVAGTSGTGTTTGSITGNWSATDGVVTTASDVNALDVSITVAGTTISGSDLANGMLNSSPINGVTYSCAGSSPVLDFQTADPAVTVPITLVPA